MRLDKYLRYVSIKGMVQKIQIRQLIATSLVGMDNSDGKEQQIDNLFYQ